MHDWELPKCFSTVEQGLLAGLLVTRATHQTNEEARMKDLSEAQIYLNRIQELIDARVQNAPANKPEPEPGAVYDDDGKILAVSTQKGDIGYDPKAHQLIIEILCDGQKVEYAYAADVRSGVVKFFERDERGRLKQGQRTGKVEILDLTA